MLQSSQDLARSLNIGISGENQKQRTAAVHLPAKLSGFEYTINRKRTTIFPVYLPPLIPSSLPAVLLALPRRGCHVFVCARLETLESRDFLSTTEHMKGWWRALGFDAIATIISMGG